MGMDGEEFFEGLDELADRNRKLVEGEEEEVREGRGREVDLQILREIVYSLESVSMGTHQLLYFSAMKYARTYLECESEGLEEAVERLSGIFDKMNLGTLSLRDGDGTELELEENAFTHDAPESGRKMCYFLAGYIAGFLENCLGASYVVNETSCSAEVEGACVFRVQER
ncbi:MAG: V4R domain-containing protein [Candidatus Nanohaloarchaea archaeon]